MQQPDSALLQALVGEWVTEDEPYIIGRFTFQPDLQNTLYVRRNHASYAVTAEVPAYEHDDLMIVYRDPHSHGMRAWYTDNEGHVINYDVSLVGDDQTIEFISTMIPDRPRYRFRYTPIASDVFRISLAVAPPEHPEEFASRIESHVRRVASAL